MSRPYAERKKDIKEYSFTGIRVKVPLVTESIIRILRTEPIKERQKIFMLRELNQVITGNIPLHLQRKRRFI